MRFLLGFLIGLALGFAAAMVVSSRRSREQEEVAWAGTDVTPPPLPQDDRMTTPAAASPA